MLGDIHIAEPGAEIGFAGKRVIEQTIHQQLPEGFQTAEYLMEHGMVDMVVSRLDLPDTLARLLKILLKEPADPVEEQDEEQPVEAAEPEPTEDNDAEPVEAAEEAPSTAEPEDDDPDNRG